jgi:hypothetical protein
MAKQKGEDNGELPTQKLSALDRLVQAAIGAKQFLGRGDDPLALQCPEVWRWLTQIYWGDQWQVTPAVITIRAGPEGMIGQIAHRDLGGSADVVVPYASEVLAALEEAIGGVNPRIKVWGRQEPKVRKRKFRN